MNIYIFDIDGVLADLRHRLRYKNRGNFDMFYEDKNVLADGLIQPGRELLESFSNIDKVWFIDDDPKNVVAVEEAFPVKAKIKVNGLVYGTERF